MLISAIDMLDGHKDTQEEICKIYRRKFDAITEEEFSRRVASDESEYEYEFGDMSYTQFRDTVGRALNNVIDSMLIGSREAGDICLPRCKWHGNPSWLFASGGLSWGDSPTDLSGDIETLYWAEIADLTKKEEQEIWQAVSARRATA